MLYDRVDRGNQEAEVTAALDELRRRNLLGYSEKQGYKIQSSAGEEWERERLDISVPRETISELVQNELKYLLADPERPRLMGRPFHGRASTRMSALMMLSLLIRGKGGGTAWIFASWCAMRAAKTPGLSVVAKTLC